MERETVIIQPIRLCDGCGQILEFIQLPLEQLVSVGFMHAWGRNYCYDCSKVVGVDLTPRWERHNKITQYCSN